MQARRDAEVAYESGERNPLLAYSLSLALRIDGLPELALHMISDMLETELTDADRMRLLQAHADTRISLGDHMRVMEDATALLEIATRGGKMRQVGIANGLIAFAHVGLGHHDEADRYFNRAINVLRRTGAWPQLNVHLSNYAQVLLDQGRPREAEQLLIEAQALPGQSPRLSSALALSISILHHQYGMHAAALVSTAEAAALLQASGMQAQEITALQMYAERLAFDGQREQAEAMRRRAQALVGEDGKGQAHQDLTSGIIAWIRGDFAEAARLFQKVLPVINLVAAWERARLQLYLLALALRDAEQVPDTVALDQALRESGSDYPLVTDAPVLADTLRWLGEQPGWQERLAAVFDTSPAGTVHLRMEPFGALEVYSRTECLRFPLKRAGELFAFLALHGPATRADLLNALFDGSTDERTVDLLKKTLRALRAALQPLLPEGADALLLERRRYHLHPLLSVSLAWRPPVLPAPGVRESGLLDVRGPFLAGERGEWVHDVRASVHQALRQHLREQAEAGNPAVQAALRAAEALE